MDTLFDIRFWSAGIGTDYGQPRLEEYFCQSVILSVIITD